MKKLRLWWLWWGLLCLILFAATAMAADKKISDYPNLANESIDDAYELLVDTGSAYNALTLSVLRDWINVDAMVYPGSGIAVSTGSAWTTSKTSPSGDIVGTTDSQSLTNKKLGSLTTNGFVCVGEGDGTLSVIKHNMAASNNPEETDDYDVGGYSVGSLWINTTNDVIWQCVDSTSEHAVWQPLGPGIIDDTAGSGTTDKVYSANKIITSYVPFTGGTFTGTVTFTNSFPVTPSSAPSTDYEVANRKYVLDTVAGIGTGTMGAQDADNVAITGGTISGVTLSYGTLSANGYKGETYSITAGENLAAYDIVSVRNDSGTAKLYKYSAATGDSDKTNVPIGMATAATTSGNAATILLRGIVYNTGWSIDATHAGKQVFGSDTTDGGVLLTAPDTSGDIVVVLGKVLNANIILLNPSVDYATVE